MVVENGLKSTSTVSTTAVRTQAEPTTRQPAGRGWKFQVRQCADHVETLVSRLGAVGVAITASMGRAQRGEALVDL